MQMNINTEKQITILVKLGVGFKGAGCVWELKLTRHQCANSSTSTGLLLFKPQSEGLSLDLSQGLPQQTPNVLKSTMKYC